MEVLAVGTGPGLLSPLSVNGLELINRIAMPPMANNKATLAGDVTDAIIEHYLKHCAGVGLVIVEHSYVKPAGRANPNQLGIHEDSNVPGLARLATAIKGAGPASAIQITHAGARTTHAAAGSEPEGPSPLPLPRSAVVPRELTPADLAELIGMYADSARRAKRAGFGAVELHGAHGYLLNQFYSPLTNQRRDRYGGSREARLRFVLEVVDAVRTAVGPGYPVMYRLGADDLIDGGISPDDGVYAAIQLARHGVDLIDVSGGLGGSEPPGSDREGYFDYLSAAIKAAVSIPVMVTGGVKQPETADRLIREGQADLVGIGRALLADPAWAVKGAGMLRRTR